MQRLGDILELVPAPPELAPALAWSLAAGPALAGRARCQSLRDGVLTLQAGDEGARRQIESIAAELRRALNRMLGENQVQRLQVLKP